MNRNTKKISLTILAIILVIAVIFFAFNNLFNKANTQSVAEAAAASETATEKNAEAVNVQAENLLKILPSDIVFGDKNAPVTIIEYASLSCPHCATFYSEGFAKLKAEYIDNGKVKFAYRDFPLNQPALAAGMLALCQVKNPATDSGKYYDFIKVLFRTQESWAFVEDFSSKLETIAKLDGMSTDKFDKCIKDKSVQERILKHRLEAAQVLQISSTPTFYVNGEVLSGYGGYGDIKKVIEKKLSGDKTVSAVPAAPAATSTNKN